MSKSSYEIEEHDKREKILMEYHKRAVNGLESLFYKRKSGEHKGCYIVHVGMQLAGIFTFIDVGGNYWNLYLDRKRITKKGEVIELTHKEMFDNFVNELCFIDDNNEFKDNKFLKGITAENLRTVRNNITHFYGLGTENVIISTNPNPNMSLEEIEKWFEKMKKRKPEVVFIVPEQLKRVALDGMRLMFMKMLGNIAKAQTDEEARDEHIDGIYRIYDKWLKDGSIYVEIPKNK